MLISYIILKQEKTLDVHNTNITDVFLSHYIYSIVFALDSFII